MRKSLNHLDLHISLLTRQIGFQAHNQMTSRSPCLLFHDSGLIISCSGLCHWMQLSDTGAHAFLSSAKFDFSPVHALICGSDVDLMAPKSSCWDIFILLYGNQDSNTGLSYWGSVFLQRRLISWKRTSWERMEKKVFFFFFGSIKSWLYFLYHQVALTAKRHSPLCLWIWIDVTVTHRTIIWPPLPSRERERLISAFQACSHESHLISAAEENALQFLQPLYRLCGAWPEVEGKKVLLPVAGYHFPLNVWRGIWGFFQKSADQFSSFFS